MKKKSSKTILLIALLLIVFIGATLFSSINIKPKKNSDTLTKSSAQYTQLEDFPNKELLGENVEYAVYLVDAVSENTERLGKLIVYDKKSDTVTKIDGTFSFFGTTIVYSGNAGKYILLSSGTYVLRNANLISLERRTQTLEDFCISNEPLFWKNYLIYSNCDVFDNRPWGAGEAPSITTINLENSQTQVLFQSNLTKHFALEKIEKDTLHYKEFSVEKEADWMSSDATKTISKTYNLLEL